MNVAIKAAREKSGKTQAQVASEVGVSDRAYLYWEKGQKKPRVDVAIRIAKALGTTVEALFREEG